MLLRHYGASAFDPNKFQPVTESKWVKPEGGLWTSPVDSKWGWKDWCDSEQFRECKEHFDLEFTGNAFVIRDHFDLKKIKWEHDPKCDLLRWPLWTPLLRAGYDAIHLTVCGQENTRFSEPYSLYGWDCETVFIMNPTSIKSLTHAKP